MYPNLKAEIARSGLTYEEILERGRKDGRLNCTVGTLSQKVNGRYEFTLNEAMCLKDILNPGCSFTYLFEKKEGE